MAGAAEPDFHLKGGDPLHELADYLKADGHTVETAAAGREGLERYRAGSFDLVVTDRAMPEMNGDQLADALRKEKRAGYLIMLTGYGDSIRADGELPDGVDFVLDKPVRLGELQQALTTVAGQAATGSPVCPL